MTKVANIESFKHVKVHISNRVATVTLDRPPVNALDSVAIRELTAVFRTLGSTTDASAIVLSAPGDRIFCAGIDLKDSSRRHARKLVDDDTTVDLLDPGAVIRECFWAIMDCPLPVIAAVNGKAIGAGLVLVACCDMIVASKDATFSVPEIKAGVLGGARHLQRLVGPFKTRKMFFTGEPEPAEEFYRLGAIESVVEPQRLMDEALSLAGRIALNSPIGLRLGKESLTRVEDLSVKEGYRIEQEYTGRVTRYNDSAEARKAYLEKRDPEWSWT